MKNAKAVFDSAEKLRDVVTGMLFSAPITHVYNPLDYAWNAHAMYLKMYAHGKKHVVFLGMNPGPWGMAQTGVPFGEVALVRDWVGINTSVNKPENEHPKRPIEGFNCKRSEVSGKRLWGLFKDRFGDAATFFKDHFVANYCPLVFMESTGKNFTPDKLPGAQTKILYEVCDQHLRDTIEALSPEWVIGVGAFAEQRAQQALRGMNVKIAKILHPSPSSPLANKNWAEKATQQLVELGVWGLEVKE